MKSPSPLSLLVTALACGLVTAGCSKSAPKQSSVAPRDSLADAVRFGEVVPLAGGGAYLVAHSSIYFVIGEKAAVVAGLPADLLLAEIQPLADGTAILSSQLGSQPGLYLLRGSKATPIMETKEPIAAQVVPVSPNGFLFAENQRLRSELKSEKSRSFGPEDDDAPNDQR